MKQVDLPEIIKKKKKIVLKGKVFLLKRLEKKFYEKN